MWTILIAFVAAAAAPSAQTTVWGGEHLEMEVTRAGARLEFDCARGTIDEPVRADAKGTFKLKGTFSPEHAGPVRDGDASASAKATYSGTIEGDTMTLLVAVEGQEPPGTTYVLTRGRPGNVRKCR